MEIQIDSYAFFGAKIQINQKIFLDKNSVFSNTYNRS